MSENVRDVLESAWLVIHHEGYGPENEQDNCSDCDRFKCFLDTGAYVNAALMLVPEGWQCSIVIFSDGSAEAVLTDDRVNPARLNDIERMGDTAALAITQAALAAKGTGDE